MEYAEALAWLYGLSARGVHLHLDRIRGAVEVREHPERGLKVIHVGGSNGKGSTCVMLERVLRAAGYRTGLFTSPHLHRYGERVRIDGEPLSDEEIARRLSELRDAAESMPPLTFFEVTALLAFEAFRDHAVDVVVLEVGLGGRLDATNVVEAPLVSVVTSISLEHRNILGDTLPAIAGEKAGILKPGAPAVFGVRAPAAQAVLLERAAQVGVPTPWVIGEEIDGRREGDDVVIRIGEEERRYGCGLVGAFQADNAACAVGALKRTGLEVGEDAITEGLREARWPGRLETVKGVLFDAAHNPEGCEALAAHLRSLPEKKTVLLFGAMREKDHERMLAPLDGLVHERVYAIPPMRRAPDPQVFAEIRPGTVAKTVTEGLELARKLAGDEGRVVVAGSIFLVHEARARLLGVATDPPIGM